jgi:hypothetical protein
MGSVVVCAEPPTIVDPPPAPLIGLPPAPLIDPAAAPSSDRSPPAVAAETDSFMGMRVGDHVRVKCAESGIELNNARLLAITKTSITVASVNGERFTLSRDSTELGAPLNWKRTTSVFGDDPPLRSSHRGAGWVLLLLVLSGAGVGGWFWVARRREAKPGRRAMPAAPVRQIPAEVPPPPKAESEFCAIENLIETRCYGTAIERLEQQIKLRPDEFKVRLQLLKVYSTIANRTQVERVLRQIEFHKHFSAEQKLEASQTISPTRDKGRIVAQVAAAPTLPATALSQQSPT